MERKRDSKGRFVRSEQSDPYDLQDLRAPLWRPQGESGRFLSYYQALSEGQEPDGDVRITPALQRAIDLIQEDIGDLPAGFSEMDKARKAAIRIIIAYDLPVVLEEDIISDFEWKPRRAFGFLEDAINYGEEMETVETIIVLTSDALFKIYARNSA